MTVLFLKLVNMSIAAGWLVIVVLLLRPVLKKVPKWTYVLLWGVVAVRLICPFSIKSALSLIPSAETIPLDIGMDTSPAIHSGVSAINSAVNPVLSQSNTPAVGASVNPLQITTAVFAAIWLLGACAMLIYAAASYLRLRRMTADAVLLRDNIFQSGRISSPFVLGIIKPRIYLPFGLEGQTLEHVVAHERTHIRRRDHWWKPLGFLLLAVYWFNLLMWAAFIMLCRDIELACDEKVIKELGSEQRADYSQALLSCSVSRRSIAACPLAFGEVGVKKRIKTVLNYKKPTFWAIALAVAICAAAALCFLTDPDKDNTALMGANYSVEQVLFAHDAAAPPLQYCVTADYQLYLQKEAGEGWDYLGALTPYELTNSELESYARADAEKSAKLRQITDAYILRTVDERFYLVFQTDNGNTYLGYGREDVNQRGQGASDDTSLSCLYRVKSSFRAGYVNVNFFERSLVNAVGKNISCFANFESDDIEGYHIAGFRAGNESAGADMPDLGFAVFQTTGEGYRLIDWRVYENAANCESGVWFCADSAVADINGQAKGDNSYDVIFICDERVHEVERVYHSSGKKDNVQNETYINAPYMSLWLRENAEGCTGVTTNFYDDGGELLYSTESIPAATRWFDYFKDHVNMYEDGALELSIPELPEVTFRGSSGQMEAISADGEITPLYSGMPIWNAYLCDLTGDGVPEMCSTVCYGSGVIDERIIVYDYVGGASYELVDRGTYDYVLRYSETDGGLYVDRYVWPEDKLDATGLLVFRDGCLQALWTSAA